MGFVALVVSGPQNQTGVLAEAAHDVPHFLGQCCAEGCALRIQGAGHREVLPDHDAVPVAPVEKEIVLIDVATPAPDHVAMQVFQHRQNPRKALPVSPVEDVGRNPIRPLDKDFLSVDPKHKLPAPGGVRDAGADQFHGADAVGERPLVDHRAVFGKADHPLVEMRFSRAPRPPEAGAGQREGQPACGRSEGLGGAKLRCPAPPLDGNLVMVHAISRKFILRRGKDVLCVFNEAYDRVGINPDTNTTSPSVERIVKDDASAQ